MDSEDIKVSEEQISRVERLSSLIKDWQIPVALIVICVTILIATGRWSIPQIPEWLQQALTVLAVGIIPATLAGKVAVVDRYLPDPRMDVLEVDPENGMEITPWKVPSGLWDHRDRGRYPEFAPPAGPFDQVVTEISYDSEEESLSVEGCNPEIAEPVSIIARNGLLKEIYGSLQDDRAALSELQATLEAKALRIDQQNVNDLISAVEHGGRFGGSAWDEIQSEEWSEDLDGDADDRDRDDPEPEEGPTLRDLLGAAKNGEAPADD